MSETCDVMHIGTLSTDVKSTQQLTKKKKQEFTISPSKPVAQTPILSTPNHHTSVVTPSPLSRGATTALNLEDEKHLYTKRKICCDNSQPDALIQNQPEISFKKRTTLHSSLKKLNYSLPNVQKTMKYNITKNAIIEFYS